LGTISEFGTSRVHAVLYATQTDGTLKTYAGDYTVADGILVDASIRQTLVPSDSAEGERSSHTMLASHL
jgi:hypothetical protein